jgi:hypothetical protein
LAAATAAPHSRRCILIYEYEKQKWRAVGAQKKRQKANRFYDFYFSRKCILRDKKYLFDLYVLQISVKDAALWMFI